MSEGYRLTGRLEAIHGALETAFQTALKQDRQDIADLLQLATSAVTLAVRRAWQTAETVDAAKEGGR